jgi:hypothetical protein
MSTEQSDAQMVADHHNQTESNNMTMIRRRRLNIGDNNIKRADELIVGDNFLDFTYHDWMPFWATVEAVEHHGDDVTVTSLGEYDSFGGRRITDFTTSEGNTFVMSVPRFHRR